MTVFIYKNETVIVKLDKLSPRVSPSPSPMLPANCQYSSTEKLVRVAAWYLKFVRNSLLKANKHSVMKGRLLV
jgi:hypothetical protein